MQPPTTFLSSFAQGFPFRARFHAETAGPARSAVSPRPLTAFVAALFADSRSSRFFYSGLRSVFCLLSQGEGREELLPADRDDGEVVRGPGNSDPAASSQVRDLMVICSLLAGPEEEERTKLR